MTGKISWKSNTIVQLPSCSSSWLSLTISIIILIVISLPLGFIIIIILIIIHYHHHHHHHYHHHHHHLYHHHYHHLSFSRAHQPANIGALKSWAAGGAEWNWSPGRNNIGAVECWWVIECDCWYDTDDDDDDEDDNDIGAVQYRWVIGDTDHDDENDGWW